MSCSSLRSFLAVAAVTFSTSAFAVPFSFSYHFLPDFPVDSAPLLTGTFDADRNGDFIDVATITNLQIKINGAAILPTAQPGMTPQFFVFGRDVPVGDWSATPVLAISAPKTTIYDNNFGIADSDVASGDQSGDLIFFLVPVDPNSGVFLYSGSAGVGNADSEPDLGTWNLAEQTAPSPLPDEGSTASALLMALAALGLLRLRRATRGE